MNTTAYVCPVVNQGQLISLDEMILDDRLRPSVAYLRDFGQVVPGHGFDSKELTLEG
ncbi:MAG: hypothetical protein HOB79_21260 [Rhodospirillaceae bacterium]|jgi:hypothetical protein|nr:hypothetical protein [Rhodospirillaceae bacterium]